MKSTNYYNTFIEVADDAPAGAGQPPPEKEGLKTVANLQFEMLRQAPYKYTSDDIVFSTYAAKKDLLPEELAAARAAFFSKGQPCLRTSPLCKRYGWGLHHDEAGKVAIYPFGSAEYEKFRSDSKLQHVKAIRTKRA